VLYILLEVCVGDFYGGFDGGKFLTSSYSTQNSSPTFSDSVILLGGIIFLVYWYGMAPKTK
jgi:hypothetical protein